MGNLIRKLSAAKGATASYRIGLTQAKAYRFLKQATTRALSPVKISTIEWALLGLLADTPKGMRAGDMAAELGVEPPFVTELSKHLLTRKFIAVAPDPKDSRAKRLSLTTAGRTFVHETEAIVRSHMRPLVSGVAVPDLLSYLYVLEQITKNYKKNYKD